MDGGSLPYKRFGVADHPGGPAAVGLGCAMKFHGLKRSLLCFILSYSRYDSQNDLIAGYLV